MTTMTDSEVLAVLDDAISDATEDQNPIVEALQQARAHIAEALRNAEKYRFLRDSVACSLTVNHNEHHCMYRSVAGTLDDSQGYYDDIGENERATMISTDTIWTVHIYPNTPVGFNVYHGATLCAAIDAAMKDDHA